MTNTITEIPEGGVQLPERQVTLHLYIWQYVQVWGSDCTLPSHQTVVEPQGNAKKQTSGTDTPSLLSNQYKSAIQCENFNGIIGK